MNTLNFEYDPVKDVLTIEGVKYAGGLFRYFAEAGPEFGPVFRMRRDELGSVTIQRIEEAQSTQGTE